MKLRPYQQTGKHEIKKAFQEHDVIFYVLATGGGKTVQFVDEIKDCLIENKRVILIAHREELILQAHATLMKNKIFGGVIMGDIKTNYALPAQVCSIQTIVRRQNLPPADLIIIDEGHHVTQENGYGKILAQYPNAKVLIVSATPYRLSGEGFTEVVKGKTTKLILNSTLQTLMNDGWLVPIRYFIASIPDLSNVHLSKGDYKEDEAAEAMNLAPIVESYKKHCNGLQGVCFAVNVSHSMKIAGQYWRAGIPAEHLDANTPDEDKTDKGGNIIRGRKSIIRDFKAGIIKVVVNVGIFTEGTDFPNCQFVQLARPTKSLSMFLQMVGRGTRATAPIDDFITSEERKRAIAESDKPHCIVLDNAGCYIDHNFPWASRDWEKYFSGWKKEKKKDPTDLMEVEIFVAKDEQGRIFRTTDIKEVEGLELIEVTTEVKRKAVNLISIKEFDRTYAIFKNSRKCPTPGKLALKKFIEYCDKNDILMVPDIWTYLRRKLILEIEEKKMQTVRNREINPQQYPDDLYKKLMENIEKEGVPEQYLARVNKEYYQDNDKQIREYLAE